MIGTKPKPITAALGFVLLAGGCAVVPEATDAPAPLPDSSYSEPDFGEESSETDTQEEATEADAGGVSKWGDTYSWQDGLQATVGKPTKFKANEYASGAEDPKAKTVKVKVTLANQTGSSFDPSLGSLTASADGEECESVFDSENKLEGTPQSTIRKGRKLSFTYGFACTSTADLQIAFSPDFEHTEAIWAQET